jgi:hypothetical protein
MPEITMDEYLSELDRLSAQTDGDGMTSMEIGRAMGWGTCKTRNKIKVWVGDGSLVPFRKPVINICGQPQTVWAYRKPQGEKQ